MGQTHPATNPPPATHRQMAAWVSFDWASNSFPTLVQTYLFANYFTLQIAPSEQQGQTQWALTIGAAGVAVALLGPIMGAVADQSGRRKPWIAAATTLCVAATAALWFIKPDSPVWPALALVAVGTLGSEAAAIFYNAMLPDLADPRRVGRWSGWGWAAGYFGGLACLVLGLFAFVGVAGHSPIDTSEARNIRATFLLAAAWFALFSLPLFLFTPDRKSTGKPLRQSTRDGLRQLLQTAKQARQYRLIVRFLLAHLFYTDGLAALFALGGVYASGVFQMNAQQIMAFGIGLNIAAGIGAFSLAWLDDWIGGKRTITLSLLGIILPGIGMLATDSLTWFWIFGLILGLFVGPVQSASRSYLSRITPTPFRGQAFGLYALSGKATAFGAPLLVFAATEWTGSQRWGMTPLFAYMTIGLILILTLPKQNQPQ